MRKTGLEFMPSTTEDAKRLVGRLFTPADIFGAYRDARAAFKTGDIVLVAAESDASGFEARPRVEFLRQLRQVIGSRADQVLSIHAIAHRSAHQMMRLPFESDAMWVVVLRGQDVPSMSVIFATPYEDSSVAVN